MNRSSVEPLEDLLDSIRDIDGFPIGKDEDILALSDPPFYTACPNPHIKQFVEEYGKSYDLENDDYERKPFFEDVREGKNDPIYNAHPYHTKVPYKAIIKYLQHYTNPGDLVFDGFCGSGMTGIASQILKRNVILLDLSPSATFIAHNLNMMNDKRININIVKEVLKKIEEEYGWLIETKHTDNCFDARTRRKVTLLDKARINGRINYTVWSDVFLCKYCGNEFIFWDVVYNANNGKILKLFDCPVCKAELNIDECDHAKIRYFDGIIKSKIILSKQVPVLINYSIGKKRYYKKPDDYDLKTLQKIEELEIPYPVLTKELPQGDNTKQPIGSHGFTYSHHFYTKRNLLLLSAIWNELKDKFPVAFTSVVNNLTKRYRLRLTGGGGPSGNLYIPSLSLEKNPFDSIVSKLSPLSYSFNHGNYIISTQSSTDLRNIPSDSIDYIFTDPPFGKNLMYSEISFLWESWLKVFTKNNKEAIINKTQCKELDEYTSIMNECFREMYRILKPNRWITIEFHNSRASVWNGIQVAITRAGFIIAQVTILDKKQGTFKQVTSPGSVKNDLIINAYKPKKEFSERFLKNAGDDMEIDFIIQLLEHLPIQSNIERTEKMLYSRMLAHYVENGFKIRYNATNFYRLLSDNFTELDGYWFLESQVKEYNKWKSGLSLDQIRDILDGQQVIFVSDEKSALTWLYYFLHRHKSYGEIYTSYQQVAITTEDDVPELKELLNKNFILENGKYRKPINQEEKEKIDQNREKELERAFQKLLKQTREQKGKIKNVRREALIYGFTKCYQEGRYHDILTIADKLYASTLESSGDIMDFVDIARIKTSGEKKIEDYY